MIIYIDNDFKNILRMINLVGYHQIENILIYDEMHTNLSTKIPFLVTSEEYKYLPYLHSRYIDFFIEKQNKFAEYLRLHSYREVYMPSNAFTENHLKRLYKIIEEYETKEIIFQWSRVLSVVDGKLENINSSLLKIEIDEIAEYIFGSKARIEMLRRMFNTLHTKNIEIFITYKRQEKNEHFLKLIRYLYPFFNESNLIFNI